MRDVIWTIIIIWAVWKIIDALKFFNSASKTAQNNQNTRPYSQESTQNVNTSSSKKGELKADAGEYVDYEEVK